MPYPEEIEGHVGRYERWDPARHGDAFAELNADPEVMRYLGGPATRRVSDELSARIADHWETFGFGLWAATERTSGRVAGFAGACRVALPGFEHEVEVGWRLARWAWGRGMATEGGALAMEHVDADHVVSVVDPRNQRSLAVTERLGMTLREEAVNPRLDARVLVLARMLDR
jgi:RimJ/RimL family protein N-acetyltransferase